VSQRERHELVLDAPVEQVVRRLLAHVPGPAAPVADGEALVDEPRRVGRAADVQHLAGTHEIVERRQRLFRVDVEARTVQLVQIDVVRAQPLERGLARPHDVPAGCALVVGARARRQADLRREHDLVATA
jgi:hypothetical protein